MQSRFDPKKKKYKSPYGAVLTGTVVTFSVYPPRDWGCYGVSLHAWVEAEEQTRVVEMEWTELQRSNDVYSCKLTAPGMPGLIWYYFQYDTLEGTLFDGANGVQREPPDAWQLTVYEESKAAPEWFGQSIAYQIFPDRFCKADVQRQKIPAGRIMHSDWTQTPEWQADAEGKIRNCDFFGGNFRGIMQKLDYLQAQGVTVLYLNPIFEAASNHRYDTGNYLEPDPLLGTTEEFKALCDAAKQKGIRILLDGVFSHTGSDSVYFNRYGRYSSLGAYQSTQSPYYKWYSFESHPSQYAAWWGIDTLPETNEEEPSYLEFIVEGKNSVVRTWLRNGASGWRLDVADELPDSFIRKLVQAAREERADAVVIGEVWEDASNKISYGKRRNYILGNALDGVMNYPLRNAILNYLQRGEARQFMEQMENLREHYPKHAWFSAMNFLGNHDTPRILSVLGGNPDVGHMDRAAQSAYQLSEVELEKGKRLLKAAALILFAFPGCPTVFYGDEAGMQGLNDPFNRGVFPWGSEVEKLQSWFQTLGQIRTIKKSLKKGEITYLYAQGAVLCFKRTYRHESVIAAVNAGSQPVNLKIRCKKTMKDLMTGSSCVRDGDYVTLALPPQSAMLIG